jgi:hypothetical protein
MTTEIEGQKLKWKLAPRQSPGSMDGAGLTDHHDQTMCSKDEDDNDAKLYEIKNDSRTRLNTSYRHD